MREIRIAMAFSLPLLVSCGTAVDSGSSPGAISDAPELIGQGLVLEDDSHGPQLCVGGVLDSYQPQCEGPDLIGWDWEGLSGFEQRDQARWGYYVVVGTYDQDAQTFTPTRPAVPSAEYDGPDLSAHRGSEEPVWFTPCPEPAGGWRVVDPALTTDEASHQAIKLANDRPDFARAWVDQSINPATELGDAEAEPLMNDPELLILNIAVTSDPAPVEQILREVWGGALCVSQVKHTAAELREIQMSLSDVPGNLGSGSGHDKVELEVFWDDGSLQEQLDQEHGPNVVVVNSALQRYEP